MICPSGFDLSFDFRHSCLLACLSFWALGGRIALAPFFARLECEQALSRVPISLGSFSIDDGDAENDALLKSIYILPSNVAIK